MSRRLELYISPLHAGKTVDTLLRRELSLSGTAVKRAKRVFGGLLLDGVPVSVHEAVCPGQTLSVLVGSTEETSSILPVPGPVEILYEDADLMVVNKRAGVAVHPGPGHPDDTLGNFIMYYYKKQGYSGQYHPVNRLDRGTSGLMVVAKHAHAQKLLIAQLHSAGFRRIYQAVCEGIPQPPEGIIDMPIGLAPGARLRRQVCMDGAAAQTQYRVLCSSQGRSLVELELYTGRTHQIRVHMAYLGHPLTGDFLYGTEDPSLISRAALHSSALYLTHPVTRLNLHWTVPLPNDMRSLIIARAP